MSCNQCSCGETPPLAPGLSLDAQTLAAGNAVFSSWMPRKGDNSIFFLDVVYLDQDELAPLTVTVSIYHKEVDDAGDGTLVSGGTISTEAPGRVWKEFSGLLSQVRYHVSVDADGADVSPAPAKVRMLQPVWFDTVLTR